MPKQRITKDMVVESAFEIARQGGMEQVLVRNIAARIGCSVQPIYSYCRNMDGLRREGTEQTSAFIRKYLAAHIDKNDLFRSTGQSWIRLAEEEPHLFKIFVFHQRDGISSLVDLYQSEAGSQTAGAIAKQLNIAETQARQLHLNMLIYTVGIGTILSVTTPGIPADEILAQQETAYQAFLQQIMGPDSGKNTETTSKAGTERITE